MGATPVESRIWQACALELESCRQLLTAVRTLHSDNDIYGVSLLYQVCIGLCYTSVLIEPGKDVWGFHFKKLFIPSCSTLKLKVCLWKHCCSHCLLILLCQSHIQHLPKAQTLSICQFKPGTLPSSMYLVEQAFVDTPCDWYSSLCYSITEHIWHVNTLYGLLISMDVVTVSDSVLHYTMTFHRWPGSFSLHMREHYHRFVPAGKKK